MPLGVSIAEVCREYFYSPSSNRCIREIVRAFSLVRDFTLYTQMKCFTCLTKLRHVSPLCTSHGPGE